MKKILFPVWVAVFVASVIGAVLAVLALVQLVKALDSALHAPSWWHAALFLIVSLAAALWLATGAWEQARRARRATTAPRSASSRAAPSSTTRWATRR